MEIPTIQKQNEYPVDRVFEEEIAIDIYDKILVIPDYHNLNTAGYCNICEKLNETIEAPSDLFHIFIRAYYSTIPNNNNWFANVVPANDSIGIAW